MNEKEYYPWYSSLDKVIYEKFVYDLKLKNYESLVNKFSSTKIIQLM